MFKFKKAFTLIELIVVIAVIGILTVFILVSFQKSRSAANDSVRKNDISNIYKSIIGKKTIDNSSYPIVTSIIAEDGTDPSLQSFIDQFLSITPYDPNPSKAYLYTSNGDDFSLATMLEDGSCFIKSTGANLFSSTVCSSYETGGIGLVQNFMMLSGSSSYNLSWTIPSALSALPASQISTAIVCLSSEDELTSFPADSELLSSGQLVAIANNGTTEYRLTPADPDYYTYCKAISYNNTIVTNPGIPDPDDPNNHPNTSSGGFTSSSYEESTPTAYEQEEASNPPDLNSGTGTGGTTSSNFVIDESRNLDGTGNITLSFIPGNLSTYTLIRRTEASAADMNIAPALITDGVEIYNKANDRDQNNNYLDPTVEHIVTDSNLNASKYYCYSAWSYVINPDNSITYSNGFVLACGSVPLSSITNLNLTASLTSFNVSFTKGSGESTIVRRTVNNPAIDLNQGTLIYNDTGTNIIDSDPSLESDTTYCYTCWSYDTNLQSISEEETSTCSVLSSIGNPSNLTLTSITNNSITLNWTLGEGTTKSWIKRVASTTPSTDKTDGEAYTGSPKIDTGLSPSTDYCYTIWAYDETTSAYSDSYVTACSTTLTPIDGTCGTAVRTFAYDETSYGSYSQCSTGTASNTNFPSQGSSETWTCSGQNGGSASSNCTATRNSAPVDGACGTANKTFYSTVTSYGTTTFCSAGTLSATPSFPAIGGSSSWSCISDNGGTTASCTAYRATACVSGGGLTCSETTYSSYTVNKYTGTGTTNWTAPSGVTSVTYLVVAGGGSGGCYNAGGGGAGGMRTSTLTVVPGQSYTVKVGAGGAAVTGQAVGNNGGDSQFATITSTGGGGGGYTNNAVSGQGKSGGSGGGGGGCATGMANMSQVPGNPVSGQGYIGGAGYTGTSKAGGGGGAGAAGGAASYSYGGNGGNGLQSSITGTSLYYAGGGGAGGSYQVDTTGGNGGGGKGSTISTDYVYSTGYPGTNGLGGGGGGSSHQSYASGKGGSGVVIIRFTTPN